jgi:flagellar motor switch protein FliN
MSHAEIKLDALEPTFAGPDLPAALERLDQVTLELTVEVGRTRMSLGQALALGPGSVITLDRLADQPVDLLVNGKPVARGEVVVIDDVFGLRLTHIVEDAEAATKAAQQQVEAELEAPAAPPQPLLEPVIDPVG